MAKYIVIKKLSEEEISKRNIRQWPIWEKEISKFPWTYDCDEECLFIEGEVVIETKEGNFTIKPGDFVIFKNGLECVWNIIKPVRKHYNFP
ncbi:MAG TPA: cupin domain-containing protein [Bacteroidales bacterium]|nr:cupin domain-containing protein [Bacteroidales bacterium]